MKKIISLSLFFVCAVLTPVLSVADNANSKLMSDFYQAQAAYKAENFSKAVELYEGLIKSGQVSGAVYYNLGNSYIKTGDLGRAILNYEKAKLYMPRDPDLRANSELAYFRMSSAQDFNPNVVKAWLWKYRDIFSVDEYTVLIVVFFFITGGLFFLALYLKWPRRRAIVVIGISCALFVFHSAMFNWKMAYYTNLALIVKPTEAKFEPLPTATSHYEIVPGWKVKVLKDEGDWLKIKRLGDGLVGWVKREAIEKI